MKVDITVVGGGLVGFATALLLSQSGFEIALIDFQDLELGQVLTKTSPYELRVSAITPQSVLLFKQLNIWTEICHSRMGCFDQIKIWENSDSSASSETPPVLFQAQGYILENKIVLQALLNQIKIKNNITLFSPAEIHKIHKTADNINISLNNNINIMSRLIIGADGTNSKIREWTEVGLTTKEYNQTALVGIIKSQFSHENIARQRFLPEGPLAFLPLDKPDYCSIVWTNTPETANKLLNYDEQDFNQIINSAWGTELGELKLASKKAVFKLAKKHAKNYVSDRVALVGDAAHVIHPLAGQGVNLGFLDAQKLAEVLGLLKKQKRDIGLFNNLRKYELARKPDNLFIQNMMDIFNKEYYRKWGIKLIKNNNILKKLIVSWMENREKIL